jgi:hypothetical protein
MALDINCHGQRNRAEDADRRPGAAGAKAWMASLAELRNRSGQECCIVACDGA